MIIQCIVGWLSHSYSIAQNVTLFYMNEIWKYYVYANSSFFFHSLKLWSRQWIMEKLMDYGGAIA